MELRDNLLKGSNVSFRKTPNHSGEFKAGDLDTIVVHYTAGPEGPSVNTLTNPRVRASAHVVINREGKITQLAPFNIITWHAGRSSYKGRTGFNKYSIGIEIVNDGPLKKSGDVYRAWYGATYNASEVIQAVHRNQTRAKYWHTYTQEQINTVTELCRMLIQEYGIKYILGHEEVAPKRKQDPGPAFPLDRLRDKLLQGGRDQDAPENDVVDMVVAANKLNIRSKPGIHGQKIAQPLTRGNRVTVIDEQGSWFKVKTEIQGWVFGKYLEPEK